MFNLTNALVFFKFSKKQNPDIGRDLKLFLNKVIQLLV